jgi:hypothetical protein
MSCVSRPCEVCRRAQELVALEPLSGGHPRWTRISLGYFIILFCLLTLPLDDIPHIPRVLVFCLECFLAIAICLRLNVVRAWWLGSEWFLERGTIFYLPPSPSPNDESVRGRYIEEGDFFGGPELREVSATLQPEDAKSLPDKRKMEISYVPVMAVAQRPNGSLRIGLLGQEQPRPIDPDKIYLRRQGPLKPRPGARKRKPESVVAVAKALDDLLDLLSRGGRGMREDIVVDSLVSRLGNSGLSARQAVRISRRAQLVSRQRAWRYVLEIPGVFNSQPVTGGHSCCTLSITELGSMWNFTRPGREDLSSSDRTDDDVSDPLAREPHQDDSAFDYVNAPDDDVIARSKSIARKVVDESPIQAPGQINSSDDLLEFVRGAIQKFRFWVEDLGGWRVFWNDSSEAMPESSMQLILLLALKNYCEMAGVHFDREVETGRGPVDFAFSGDRRTRVLVEMKKISHKEFWQGLRVQTPIYMRSQEVERAVFLVVRDSDRGAANQRWHSIVGEADVISRQTGLRIKVERVDILSKQPASRAKNFGQTN